MDMIAEIASKLLQDMIDSTEELHTDPAYVEALIEGQVALRECTWVNVADRLPTEGVNVLVSFVEMDGEEVYDAGVTMAYYDAHEKTWSNMGTAKVTAWRPLPEPVDNITVKD